MTKGTYFIGSTSLAIPVSEFEARYPSFMMDTDACIVGIRSTNKHGHYRVAIRLFLRYLRGASQFKTLEAALAAPSSDRLANLCTMIEEAVISFYGFFCRHEAYKEKTARKYAQFCSFIFRRLGEDPNKPYPRIGARIAYRVPFTGGVRKSSLPRPIEPLAIKEIEDHFGPLLMKDVSDFRAAKGARPVLGFLYFLSWLVNVSNGGSDLVMRALRGDSAQSCDPSAVVHAVDECERFMFASKAFSSKTIIDRKAKTAFLLQHLGGLANRTYPSVKRNHITSVHVRSITTDEGIADLNLPGTEGLETAAKLRKSLELIQHSALQTLNDYVEIFNALRPARENIIPSNVDPRQHDALKAIGTVMQAEIKSLKESGFSQFASQGVRSNELEVVVALEKIRRASTWHDAGVYKLVPHEESLTLLQARMLLNAGIGAVRTSVLAAKIVFCTDTGWNRQPIDSLPSSLFLFEIGGKAGVASAKFVSEFKKRAGHDVLAMLQTSISIGGMKEGAVIAAWEETDRSHNWLKSDERAIITKNTPAYTALKLVHPMLEALNEFPMAEALKGRLFKYLTWTGGVSAKDREINTSFDDGILATKGITFASIRKAVLRLELRTIGSVDGVRPKAGHASTAVLLASYLNSPETIRELEQSTRFFQNAMQSLLVADVGSSLGIKLNLSAEDQEWFYNLAHASGVASAVGYGVALSVQAGNQLVFKPTTSRIRELVSLELSLEEFKETTTARRWALVGVPLLGYVTAIKQKLVTANLGNLAISARSKLLKEISSGKVVLQRLSVR